MWPQRAMGRADDRARQLQDKQRCARGIRGMPPDPCDLYGSPDGDAASLRISEHPGRPAAAWTLLPRRCILVDVLHDRVAATGAPIPIALHDTDYGSRDFACADPEGNAWSFGTYAPPPPAH